MTKTLIEQLHLLDQTEPVTVVTNAPHSVELRWVLDSGATEPVTLTAHKTAGAEGWAVSIDADDEPGWWLDSGSWELTATAIALLVPKPAGLVDTRNSLIWRELAHFRAHLNGLGWLVTMLLEMGADAT